MKENKRTEREEKLKQLEAEIEKIKQKNFEEMIRETTIELMKELGMEKEAEQWRIGY